MRVRAPREEGKKGKTWRDWLLDGEIPSHRLAEGGHLLVGAVAEVFRGARGYEGLGMEVADGVLAEGVRTAAGGWNPSTSPLTNGSKPERGQCPRS